MSAELIGILAVGATLLIGLDGLIQMLGNWLRGDIRSLSNRVQLLGDRIGRVEGILEASGMFGPTAVAKSPLALTDLCEEKSKELGAKEWAKMMAQVLLTHDTELYDLMDFEIDGFCKEYVAGKLPKEWKRKVAETAYQRGLGKESIAVFLRIELRDEIIMVKAGQNLEEPLGSQSPK